MHNVLFYLIFVSRNLMDKMDLITTTFATLTLYLIRKYICFVKSSSFLKKVLIRQNGDLSELSFGPRYLILATFHLVIIMFLKKHYLFHIYKLNKK